MTNVELNWHNCINCDLTEVTLSKTRYDIWHQPRSELKCQFLIHHDISVHTVIQIQIWCMWVETMGFVYECRLRSSVWLYVLINHTDNWQNNHTHTDATEHHQSPEEWSGRPDVRCNVSVEFIWCRTVCVILWTWFAGHRGYEECAGSDRLQNGPGQELAPRPTRPARYFQEKHLIK